VSARELVIGMASAAAVAFVAFLAITGASVLCASLRLWLLRRGRG